MEAKLSATVCMGCMGVCERTAHLHNFLFAEVCARVCEYIGYFKNEFVKTS